MNFEEFIRHVTGQDREERALKDFQAYLVNYFLLEHPNAPRPQIEKDAEQWAEVIIDKRKNEFINYFYAASVREQFLKFKEEDKSRKAKKSRSMRKKAKKRKPHFNKKDEPVIREAYRDKVERNISVSDEQAKRRFRPRSGLRR